jgi:hypothetical protein
MSRPPAPVRLGGSGETRRHADCTAADRHMKTTTTQAPRADNGVSIATSFERLLTSGQQLVEHRLDLLRFDARVRAIASARGAGAATLGGVVLLLGWVALMVALTSWLRAAIGLEPALALVGVVHLVAGGLFLAWGLHALRQPGAGD